MGFHLVLAKHLTQEKQELLALDTVPSFLKDHSQRKTPQRDQTKGSLALQTVAVRMNFDKEVGTAFLEGLEFRHAVRIAK
jgi:hypothetical protein